MGILGSLWLLIMSKNIYIFSPQVKKWGMGINKKKNAVYIIIIYFNWHWPAHWRASNSLSWYPCSLTASGSLVPAFIILRVQTCHPTSGLHLFPLISFTLPHSLTHSIIYAFLKTVIWMDVNISQHFTFKPLAQIQQRLETHWLTQRGARNKMPLSTCKESS